ncbi:low molecular weight protein tyrosine phosphatase family protein [Allorhodopirellula heiligendammensis]|uniref:Low molecular weight phosphotyrosine protein phosphatase n=1 Tax=Allorhodopirellula heiligendammensis TaxID=2714739 RepID=A0A5C6C5C5_9BACT|nr:protein tyrosine phosphatase [Allorhodopirellula heiligendammensis]TWU18751.1 Low molecular weight phosphotyrosine protein phosphatase [Allorhodopirellula heiligendammensis]
MSRRPCILFVCSKNQWRSPTAEAVYCNDDRISVRSRGTARAAVQSIRSSDIVWADVILVMEDKHRQRIQANFPGESKYKPVHVLVIPDDYPFMDAELVDLIKSATESIIVTLQQS